MKRIEKHTTREITFDEPKTNQWAMPGTFDFVTHIFPISTESNIAMFLKSGWQVYEQATFIRETSSTVTFYRPLINQDGKKIEWNEDQS